MCSVVRVRERDRVRASLTAAGIGTGIHYPVPIHRQPAYAELGYGPGSLPITERLCTEVLSLPIFPELSAEQQQRVIAVLHELTGGQAGSCGDPVAVPAAVAA